MNIFRLVDSHLDVGQGVSGRVKHEAEITAVRVNLVRGSHAMTRLLFSVHVDGQPMFISYEGSVAAEMPTRVIVHAGQRLQVFTTLAPAVRLRDRFRDWLLPPVVHVIVEGRT